MYHQWLSLTWPQMVILSSAQGVQARGSSSLIGSSHLKMIKVSSDLFLIFFSTCMENRGTPEGKR